MEENKGWVCLWRKLLESQIWRSGDAELFKIFVWCLLKATHAPHEITYGKETILVERGQFITGQHVASDELGMTGSMYRRKLQKLIDLGIATTKVVSRFTIVTICKYSTYQDVTLEQPINQQQPNNDITINTTIVAKRSIKKQSPKHDETRPLLETFCAKYKDKFDKPYIIKWAKDGASIKRLLNGGLTYTTIAESMDMFLHDEDSFLLKTGYEIALFASRINRYAGAKPQPTHLDLEFRE